MDVLKNKAGQWVVGDDFFGRDLDVERLIELIDAGHHLLLAAPRRIGKTSLVRETFRRLDHRGSDITCFIDVQAYQHPTELIVALGVALSAHHSRVHRAGSWLSRALEGLADRVDSVGVKGVLELKLREEVGGDWRAKGRDVVQAFASLGLPVVICLDELPIMLHRMVTQPPPDGGRESTELFLSWLREVTLDHSSNVRWITCGSIGLEPVLARFGLTSTIGHLRPFHLHAWDRGTADACLRALARQVGAPWPETATAELLNTLQHFVPYHVQMFFGHVIDDCRQRGTNAPADAADIARVYRERMLSTRGHAELRDYEERLLRVLEREHQVLAMDALTFASVAGILSTDELTRLADAAEFSDAAAARRVVIDVLEHDGYLLWNDEANGWMFVSPLLRDWWKLRFGRFAPSVERKSP